MIDRSREWLLYAERMSWLFPRNAACQRGRRIAWRVWWRAVREWNLADVDGAVVQVLSDTTHPAA